jgi:hypothetical protein
VTVAFDASILLPLLNPTVPGPLDPNANKPLESCRERLDYLIEGLEKDRTKIVIPTPALSEILVYADEAGPRYLDQIRASRAFKIEPFDERAAAEVAFMIREYLKPMGKKRRKSAQHIWAKVKFDQQIVAIAKVNGAAIIYSDDRGVRTFAEQSHLTVIGLAQLPLPPPESQMEMFDPKKSGSVEIPATPKRFIDFDDDDE